jgi:hypothetical protein
VLYSIDIVKLFGMRWSTLGFSSTKVLTSQKPCAMLVHAYLLKILVAERSLACTYRREGKQGFFSTIK